MCAFDSKFSYYYAMQVAQAKQAAVDARSASQQWKLESYEAVIKVNVHQTQKSTIYGSS